MSNRETNELSDRESDLGFEFSAQPPPQRKQGAIARFFKFQDYQTNIRTEVLAGATTFMTMAYILVVNPGILSDAIFLQKPGDLFNELVIATAISAAIATLIGVDSWRCSLASRYCRLNNDSILGKIFIGVPCAIARCDRIQQTLKIGLPNLSSLDPLLLGQ
jgi:hypothetical protein